MRYLLESNFSSAEKLNKYNFQTPKGQKMSKAIFLAFNSSKKKQKKKFANFRPSFKKLKC